MSRNVIAIVGPTASGKSELAVKIAKKLKGEIISADSRQIYKGLDIGTGKMKGRWILKSGKKLFFYKGVSHYLVDEISPKRDFSAGEFKNRAEKIIDDIRGRGLVPIVVGGTNFWIDALLRGTVLPNVSPNKKLRRALKRKTAAELFRMLETLDPSRAKSIDPKMTRRLIRAIEIARALGRVPRAKKALTYRAFWIGIDMPTSVLKANLKKRATRMIAQGLLAETKSLAAKQVSKKRLRTLGLEYSLSLDILAGALEKKKFASALTARDLRYAKKQLAWLEKNPDIRWVKTKNEGLGLVRKFTKL